MKWVKILHWNLQFPDHLNYPEFTNRKEADKILKLVSSGVLRTHSDTFNSLDASLS